MKDTIARQLETAVKSYEEQLQSEAKGIPEAENSLRWSKAHIPYEVIAPFMTRENLSRLAKQKCSRRTLFSLSGSRLRYEDRYLFWEDILSAVDILPTEWRAKICWDSLHSSDSWVPRERNGKVPYYNFNDYDHEALEGYVASSKWLVDAPLVRKWYCRLHKPDYELLACIDQKRVVNFPMRKKLLECIEDDDLPEFGLHYAMCCQHGNWTLLQDVLQKDAKKIFAWLVENDTDVFHSVNPYHLMVYCVVNLKSERAIEALRCIERRFPGTASQIDAFGNNLLWYTLHNHYSGVEPIGKLIIFLCQCGCRMDTTNHLGLSYSDVCKVATHAKHNPSQEDDFKEQVLHELLQTCHCSVLKAKALMWAYDKRFQKYFERNYTPDWVAVGMVFHCL